MRSHSLPLFAATAAAQTVSTAFQLDDVGTWFENLAVRSDGSVLATRMDAPEIWAIDPVTQTGEALVIVPGVLSTSGIAELREDVFVFAAGNVSFVEPVGVAPGSMGVWKVDLSEGTEPELVAAFPDAGFLNGMATWDEERVLVGDSGASAVYLLDVETGEFEVALNGSEVAGVNGLRVHGGDVYAVSTTEPRLNRIPVDDDCRIAGEVEVLAEDLGLDDFDVGADGAIYAVSPSENVVLKIFEGLVTTIAGGPDSQDVLAPTSARIGRAGGEDTLYVTTTGNGLFAPPGAVQEPASIVAVSLRVDGGEEEETES